MKLILGAPLVAVVLAGAGVGAYYAVAGAGSGEEAPAAQATATPTATPATPTVAPTPTPAPTETATATPAPEGGQAPKGCLPTELAYVDPDGRFAFCYPADMELVTVDTEQGVAPTVRHPVADVNRLDPNAASVTFTWQVERHNITGDPCTDSPFLIQNRRTENWSIAGRNVDACLQEHYDRDDAGSPTVLLYKTVEMEVPTASAFLGLYIAYTGPDFVRQGVRLEDTALRILDSAVIY